MTRFQKIIQKITDFNEAKGKLKETINSVYGDAITDEVPFSKYYEVLKQYLGLSIKVNTYDDLPLLEENIVGKLFLVLSTNELYKVVEVNGELKYDKIEEYEDLELSDLDFSQGDVVLTAKEGKDALSKVTLKKPENMASLIAKKQTLFGVEGTASGGGELNINFESDYNDTDKIVADNSIISKLPDVTLITTNEEELEENLKDGEIGVLLYPQNNNEHNELNINLNNQEPLDTTQIWVENDLIYEQPTKTYVTSDESIQDLLQDGEIAIITEPQKMKFEFVGQEDALIERTLTSYSNDRVTSIGQSTFRNYGKLESIDFPNVTIINQSAFEYCVNLESIDFPNVTTIDGSAFSYCKNLESADFPNVTTIGSSAFCNCSNLKNVIFPNVTSIGSRIFENCSKLSNVNFPKVQSVDTKSFNGTIITNIELPSLITLLSNALFGMPDLERAYLPILKEIQIYAFKNCHSLKKVIIEQKESVCTLSGTYAFGGCYHILGTVDETYNPDGLADGYIYVPDELVEDYKVATNWSTYASQIKPLSELDE